MNPEPNARTVALAGLAVLAVAMGIGRFAFTPILPVMQGEYGLSVVQGGWLASANYAGYLAGAVSAVWLRAGSASIIRGSLVVVGCATLGMGLTDSYVLWMILRLVAGAGSAWAMVFVTAWCLDKLALRGRAELAGLVFSGVGAGMALAGILCLALMRVDTTAPQMWLVFGGASLVVTALAWRHFASRPGSRAETGTPASANRFRWTSDEVRLVACYGVFGFGYIIPATFVPAMARQVASAPSVFGWAWPLFGIAAMVSTLVAGRLTRAFGNRAVWSGGVAVMAAAVAAPASFPGMAAILLAAVCVGATFMVVTMAAMQEARSMGGTHARRLIGAITASFAAGQVAGPIAVSGFAAAGGGIGTVLAAAAALLAASAFAIAWPTADKRKTNEALPE